MDWPLNNLVLERKCDFFLMSDILASFMRGGKRRVLCEVLEWRYKMSGGSVRLSAFLVVWKMVSVM